MKKIFVFIFVAIQFTLVAAQPNFLLFGPPGSGKGTFAQLARERGYNHFSAGDLIRSEIQKKTPFGLIAEEIVKKGEYVDPVVFREMVKNHIIDLFHEGKPFIVDNFGKNDEDMLALIDCLDSLKLDNKTLVIFFDAEDDLCIERIANRLVCSSCMHIFSKSQTEYKDSTCPYCHEGKLEVRINDTSIAIKKRLDDYREKNINSYKICSKRYPTIFFNVNQGKSECLEFYTHFLDHLEKFDGDLSDLCSSIFEDQ